MVIRSGGFHIALCALKIPDTDNYKGYRRYGRQCKHDTEVIGQQPFYGGKGKQHGQHQTSCTKKSNTHADDDKNFLPPAVSVCNKKIPVCAGM